MNAKTTLGLGLSFVLVGAGIFLEPEAVLAAPSEAATAEGIIYFDRDWNETLEGELVAGGLMTIEYDLQRLPQCMRDTYNGFPAWNTTAYGQFFPGGEFVQADVAQRVRDHQGEYIIPVLATFEVPTTAARIELWFVTGGRVCGVHYDSNYSENYGFDISTE